MNAPTALRIDITPPHSDAEKVLAIIAPYEAMLGKAPSGLRMLGASPTLLEHYASTLHYYMEHPRLGAPLLTFIRYLVSWRGDCNYCIDLNEAFLVNAGLHLKAVRATRYDPTLAPLDDRDKSMLVLALDAVDRPKSVTKKRLDALRALGWHDRDILDAVWHANLNRAFGRTAESLGLPPDNYLG